jgi:hypothetical protein
VLALLASVLVLSYLLIPGVLFKVGFSWFVPLRAFDRTRAQELAYSSSVCFLPLLIAVLLVWYTSAGQHPFAFPDDWSQRDADYRTLFLTSFSDQYASRPDELWGALTRVCRRHGRLLFWYYLLVVFEAALSGSVASRWGRIQPRVTRGGRLDRAGDRLLLRNISEWHVLLTNFLFPGTTMHVDVMTAEDRLFRGEVLTHTVDRDGNLTGLYLNNSERFNRRTYLSAAEAAERSGAPRPKSSDYWTPIPGDRLFVFGDKLLSLNIRPQTTIEAAAEIARQLDATAKVTVEQEPPGPTGPDPAAPRSTIGP